MRGLVERFLAIGRQLLTSISCCWKTAGFDDLGHDRAWSKTRSVHVACVAYTGRPSRPTSTPTGQQRTGGQRNGQLSRARVDAGYAIATTYTRANALYPGVSRGREARHAYQQVHERTAGSRWPWPRTSTSTSETRTSPWQRGINENTASTFPRAATSAHTPQPT
jgi:hypothetical protein